MTQPARHILPVIVSAQFCCTSLWFAGNGVMGDLIAHFDLKPSALGHLTTAVQLGFIIGTLLFALFTITDRFSPSKVFLYSALLGALCNLGILWQGNGLTSISGFRFLTGFFLAGIYPVGMKIAADHFDKGLNKSLSFLVGALVLGTALPHLLKGILVALPWPWIVASTSAIAILGGILLILWVPDGPYRKPGQALDFMACFTVFRNKGFRAAAFGYFGHAWELYAFWTFVPVMLSTYAQTNPNIVFNVPLLSFATIAIGGLACVLGGFISQKKGVSKTARWALALSGLCCMVSPLFFVLPHPLAFVGFLLFWGMVVIADSPLFSTLVAQSAPLEVKGTALTMVNCIGFAITIASLQVCTLWQSQIPFQYLFVILAPGPIFGWITTLKKKVKA
ncbi:MAG: MFS transporter [Bacteroidota bacterium]